MACERPFERVHTMTDYYDGPRRGIADYNGRPHLYESTWDDLRDNYADIFELRPVDPETFALALESWAIWLRWEDAYYANQTTIETHPALPAERARRDEIDHQLVDRLAQLGDAIRARGVFRPQPGHEHGAGGRFLQVQWTVIESTDADAIDA